uniref:Uncharacterized protein n=1 Tax=Catharus ustulatus TaxID=91951 RepID=A0A8C3U8N4_CATUS
HPQVPLTSPCDPGTSFLWVLSVSQPWHHHSSSTNHCGTALTPLSLSPHSPLQGMGSSSAPQLSGTPASGMARAVGKGNAEVG